jgi:hypothetical protein
MRTIKTLILALLALWGLPLRAQPASSTSLTVSGMTNPPPYQARVERVGGTGLLPANFAYISFSTNKFGFVMPEGFRLETENWDKVTLVSSDLRCFLTFRVLEYAPASQGDPDPIYCRQTLLDRHPNGKITEEFSLAAVSRRGPAYDLQWNAKGQVPRRVRALYIASEAGLLEFSLVSSPDKFEAGRQAFEAFLITFRVADISGRLNMPVLSDRL